MRLAFFLLVLFTWSFQLVQSTGFGLVARQSDCKIRCENGGMCAFSFEDESVHTCICLMGVYEGDRCQYQVGEDPSKIKADERARKAEQQKLLEDAKRREQERLLREEERQNAERRRIHETKIREEEEKRRVENERTASDRIRMEEERQKEVLRRQEEVKRREEERRRYDEERRRLQLERERDEMDKENRRIQEEKRVKEEERKEQEKIKEQPELEEDLVDDDMEPDATAEEWNYEDENKEDTVKEDAIENEGTEAESEWTEDKNIQEMNKKEDLTSSSGSKNPFGPLADVIEKAADMTLKEHSKIINEADQEKGDMHESEDDYWDHHPKKEVEEYEVPKVMDSEEEDEIRRDHLNPQKDASNTREFAAEESEDGDGWMMVSRTESQESIASLTNLLLTLSILIAYYII